MMIWQVNRIPQKYQTQVRLLRTRLSTLLIIIKRRCSLIQPSTTQS
jgi:hypothetical protein